MEASAPNWPIITAPLDCSCSGGRITALAVYEGVTNIVNPKAIANPATVIRKMNHLRAAMITRMSRMSNSLTVDLLRSTGSSRPSSFKVGIGPPPLLQHSDGRCAQGKLREDLRIVNEIPH